MANQHARLYEIQAELARAEGVIKDLRNEKAALAKEVMELNESRAHMARQAHVREDLYSKLHAALMELEHKHARTTAAVREVQERFELERERAAAEFQEERDTMQIANEALVATLTARIDLLTHQNERMKSLLHQTRIDADFRLAQEKAESEKLAAKVKRLERDLNVPIPGHLKTPTQLSRRNKQLQYSLDVMNQSNQKYVSQLQEAEAEKRRLLQQVARLEQQIRDDSQIGDRENIIGLKESFELLWTEKRHGADRKPGLRLKENAGNTTDTRPTIFMLNPEQEAQSQRQFGLRRRLDTSSDDFECYESNEQDTPTPIRFFESNPVFNSPRSPSLSHLTPDNRADSCDGTAPPVTTQAFEEAPHTKPEFSIPRCLDPDFVVAK